MTPAARLSAAIEVYVAVAQVSGEVEVLREPLVGGQERVEPVSGVVDPQEAAHHGNHRQVGAGWLRS